MGLETTIYFRTIVTIAMYCKIGLISIEKNGLGISGHATSIIGAPLVAIISSSFRLMLAGLVGVATIMAEVYCLSRYATNIGIHTDVANVPVEDLAVNICWSTDSEPSFDEISTTQALRRNKISIHNIEGCEIVEGLVPN